MGDRSWRLAGYFSASTVLARTLSEYEKTLAIEKLAAIPESFYTRSKVPIPTPPNV